MQYFNFSRLIHKYMSEFDVIVLRESYLNDVGEWETSGSETVTMQGAVISYRDSKIWRSEGNLTTKDRKLFMLQPIDESIMKSKVVYEGDMYSLEDSKDNAKFTGVWAYSMKYVSAFNGGSV